MKIKRGKAKAKLKVTQATLLLFVCAPVLCVIAFIQIHFAHQSSKELDNIQKESAATELGPPRALQVESSRNTKHDGLVVDMMSIGSKTRIHYQETQRTTFASHKSVRFFFNITESDDADPTCSDNFAPEDAYAVSDICHKRHWRSNQFLMRYLRGPYARKRWLKNKAAPHGWMCAQVRPSHGLRKVIDKYRALQPTHGDKALPDYLFIADDDTYVNFEHFEQYMSTFDAAVPRAVAGCIVRSPIWEVNFTIPFGGFGMVFSRGAIQNYMRPVHCSGDAMDDFSESACRRIKQDQIGERHLFQDGMSISDLQVAYASWQPYVGYKNWTTGFCLHSDWMWGFFSNFYNISKHNDEKVWKDVPHARMDGYNLSEIYAGKNDAHHAGLKRICNNEKENCHASSHICHYQGPEDMQRLTLETKRAFPANFR